MINTSIGIGNVGAVGAMLTQLGRTKKRSPNISVTNLKRIASENSCRSRIRRPPLGVILVNKTRLRVVGKKACLRVHAMLGLNWYSYMKNRWLCQCLAPHVCLCGENPLTDTIVCVGGELLGRER